jgi:hypothetical protein
MKSDGFLKQAVSVFVIALILYIFAYAAIEQRRKHDGPWQITFTNDMASVPAMLIAQPKLAITNVQIVFPDMVFPTNSAPSRFEIEQPRAVPFDVRFGRCMFLDLTSLPGTIVFSVFGHEIQLLPRVLTIDKTERSWQSGMVISLPAIGSFSETNRP